MSANDESYRRNIITMCRDNLCYYYNKESLSMSYIKHSYYTFMHLVRCTVSSFWNFNYILRIIFIFICSASRKCSYIYVNICIIILHMFALILWGSSCNWTVAISVLLKHSYLVFTQWDIMRFSFDDFCAIRWFSV